jgi:prevent-host-death family protein
MSDQPTPTETMYISAVKQQLNSLVNRVYRNETRILVEKSGIPVAALVSADDLQRLTWLDEECSQRFSILEQIGEVFKDVPIEELEREVERALNNVRADRRANRFEAIEEFAAGFADQSPLEIERETASALAAVRAEPHQRSRANG